MLLFDKPRSGAGGDDERATSLAQAPEKLRSIWELYIFIANRLKVERVETAPSHWTKKNSSIHLHGCLLYRNPAKGSKAESTGKGLTLTGVFEKSA